jgi:hypothetical protein
MLSVLFGKPGWIYTSSCRENSYGVHVPVYPGSANRNICNSCLLPIAKHRNGVWYALIPYRIQEEPL